MPKNQHLKVDVPNRSGFNLSHENILTQPVGTLVPILCEETMPNGTYNLQAYVESKLAPMATDFYGRVQLKVEAFFCPWRLLWGSYGDYIKSSGIGSYQSAQQLYPTRLPRIDLSGGKGGTGTLADYLGIKHYITGNNDYCLLPFLAYHRIYDEYYRNKQVQTALFQDFNVGTGSALSVSNIPWVRTSQDLVFGTSTGQYSPMFPDGVEVTDLRQRNYGLDYFTAATPSPILGGTQSAVSIHVDSLGDGQFTIAQLRSANAIQKFLEKNNITGFDEDEIIRLQYGRKPSSAIFKKPLYLGSGSLDLYCHSVSSTVPNVNQVAADDPANPYYTNNPTGMIGAEYGQPHINGQLNLINNFECTEHGYIMVLASIVPSSIYSTGTRRYIMHNRFGDIAWPSLAGVGDQPINSDELSDQFSNAVFGYAERYAEYRFHPNEVHGLLNDGESLSAFALKRGFSGTPSINSSFLEIPTTALDELSVMNAFDGAGADDPTVISDFGAWSDFYFDFRAILPLPEYSIPTLENDSDTHKIDAVKMGSSL